MDVAEPEAVAVPETWSGVNPRQEERLKQTYYLIELERENLVPRLPNLDEVR